jgi:Mce-associated membrane protein
VSGRRAAVTGTAVLIAVLVATSGFLGWRLLEAERLQSARTESQRAATTAVTDMLSYDYQSLDADLARGQAHLTPAFARQYKSVTDATVREIAAENKVVTSATAPAVAVVSAKATTVRLLMYVNQLTSSSPRGKKDENNVVQVSRINVTMQKSDGRWLVSDLRPV